MAGGRDGCRRRPRRAIQRRTPAMPSAIFRIFAVSGQNTTTEGDPFIDVGYYSAGNVGASTYANEPINVIAAPRSNGYPASRWVALKTSQASINAWLYTETFDFSILDGQITAVKVIGPAGAQVYQATIEVRRASSLSGGATWANLNK